MKCPGCGLENLEGARFCSGCGGRLSAAGVDYSRSSSTMDSSHSAHHYHDSGVMRWVHMDMAVRWLIGLPMASIFSLVFSVILIGIGISSGEPMAYVVASFLLVLGAVGLYFSIRVHREWRATEEATSAGPQEDWPDQYAERDRFRVPPRR